MTHIERLFGSMRSNRKGRSVVEIYKQLLCYYVDGTSRHLVYFDRLKEDTGYAGAIESAPHDLVSSHGMKRFFNKFFSVSYLLRQSMKRDFYSKIMARSALNHILWRIKLPRLVSATLKRLPQKQTTQQ